VTAQLRGRLDEAEDWYSQSLTIKEDLGNRPYMAITYAQLGLLAETRSQPEQALQWNIRSVSLFSDFPSPLTGTAPAVLARLTSQLGITTLQTTWQQVTGQPLPPDIRDHLTRPQTRHDWRPAADTAILAPTPGPSWLRPAARLTPSPQSRRR
jgi:hypothetical protein